MKKPFKMLEFFLNVFYFTIKSKNSSFFLWFYSSGFRVFTSCWFKNISILFSFFFCSLVFRFCLVTFIVLLLCFIPGYGMYVSHLFFFLFVFSLFFLIFFMSLYTWLDFLHGGILDLQNKRKPTKTFALICKHINPVTFVNGLMNKLWFVPKKPYNEFFVHCVLIWIGTIYSILVWALGVSLVSFLFSCWPANPYILFMFNLIISGNSSFLLIFYRLFVSNVILQMFLFFFSMVIYNFIKKFREKLMERFAIKIFKYRNQLSEIRKVKENYLQLPEKGWLSIAMVFEVVDETVFPSKGGIYDVFMRPENRENIKTILRDRFPTREDLKDEFLCKLFDVKQGQRVLILREYRPFAHIKHANLSLLDLLYLRIFGFSVLDPNYLYKVVRFPCGDKYPTMDAPFTRNKELLELERQDQIWFEFQTF